MALERTYESAGYGADTMELLEAHGTATKAGDASEFAALWQVFGRQSADRRKHCALGSVKSQIGHTKAAAGMFKVAMSLHHKVLPPTINVDIEESPFYLTPS